MDTVVPRPRSMSERFADFRESTSVFLPQWLWRFSPWVLPVFLDWFDIWEEVGVGSPPVTATAALVVFGAVIASLQVFHQLRMEGGRELAFAHRKSELAASVAEGRRTEERHGLTERIRDLRAALDYGFQVPVKLETLKQYGPSVKATMLGEWFNELVAQAKLGDAQAKTHIPAVAAALMDTMADWGASSGRAKATAKVEAAMQDLGLPWTRPLEPGET